MQKNILGIDVGGTHVFGARFSSNFEIEKKIQIPTEAKKGREKVLENILHTIQELRDDQTKGIGVSWAGFVDGDSGIVKKSPHIPDFQDFDLVHFLQEKVSLPSFMENDGRLFAFAESKTLSPSPKVLLGIVFGTGVGSGIVIDGQIFSGGDHFAGEVGHMVLHTTEGAKEAEELFSASALEEFLGMDMWEAEKKIQQNKEKIQFIGPASIGYALDMAFGPYFSI